MKWKSKKDWREECKTFSKMYDKAQQIIDNFRCDLDLSRKKVDDLNSQIRKYKGEAKRKLIDEKHVQLLEMGYDCILYDEKEVDAPIKLKKVNGEGFTTIDVIYKTPWVGGLRQYALYAKEKKVKDGEVKG